MNNIFKYLRNNFSTNPKEVDRLFISAFLILNNLKVTKNKLLNDYFINEIERDEYNNLLKFITIIEKELIHFDFEKLTEFFEFVISPADRIVNGAIYTPLNIREFIIKESFEAKNDMINNIKISDIACGCGGFLFNASKELKYHTKKTYAEIFKNHIYGLDIQEYSINRTKLLLSLLALIEGEDIAEFEFNLFVGDALEFDWKKEVDSFKGFDIVLGNPPYVCARNLDTETKNNLFRWEVSQSGNSDLYIPFFQIGVELLSKNGILGFITMNSFFKSLNGRALRNYFQNKSFDFKIIDFGAEQIFKSKNTYTCICFIQNVNKDYISYIARESARLNLNKSYKKVYYNGLDSKKGWNLHNNKNITKIESTGIPFKKLYKTRHGIATLKNDIYIFKPVEEDKEFYYLQNSSSYKIEKEICRDIVNSNKLSRNVEISKLKEKVIFPYDNKNKPKLLEEKVIKDMYPNAFKYLNNKRYLLNQRDKGFGKYENWFAFGRTQSLEKIKNKMFFPKYSDRTPSFIINTDENLLFYNGLAIVGSSEIEMEIIKKIMESSVFWYYIQSTSKPYASNYYSLNGNYINNFGICNLNELEKNYVLNEQNRIELDKFFEKKYDIVLK
ncbi:MAG: N-6 DNA methylase [Candidatus Kapabacteria bacterium]|nr:N-6 DNA methylase [Candidatus Kapabacteria bacterium]